jgi:hypothetical protein
MMEITRNQYYMAGLVLVFLGIQFRMVDTVELNKEFSHFLAARTAHPIPGVGAATPLSTSLENAPPRKVVTPPEWLGWSLLSIGSVLVLHSWAMKKPGAP